MAISFHGDEAVDNIVKIFGITVENAENLFREMFYEVTKLGFTPNGPATDNTLAAVLKVLGACKARQDEAKSNREAVNMQSDAEPVVPTATPVIKARRPRRTSEDVRKEASILTDKVLAILRAEGKPKHSVAELALMCNSDWVATRRVLTPLMNAGVVVQEGTHRHYTFSIVEPRPLGLTVA